MRKITFIGAMKSLNEYINAERSNRYAGAGIKKQQTAWIQLQCIGIVPVVHYPVRVLFHWHTKDTRKDPDNIDAARKFVLDGLVKAGVLVNDSWRYINGGFDARFFIDAKNPRLELTILEYGEY